MGNVAVHQNSPVADTRGDVLTDIVPPSGDDDARTLLREKGSATASDATGRAGDDGDLPFQFRHSRLPSCRLRSRMTRHDVDYLSGNASTYYGRGAEKARSGFFVPSFAFKDLKSGCGPTRLPSAS